MCLMALTDVQVEKFRELYRRKYGKEISKERAIEQAMKLLTLLHHIYEPITIKRFEEIKKYRTEVLPGIIAKVASQENIDMV